MQVDVVDFNLTIAYSRVNPFFANLKCQVVEMFNMRPVLLTSWHFEFSKLRPLWKRLGSS